jgi:proteasome lid subunit RPN8/RPN11
MIDEFFDDDDDEWEVEVESKGAGDVGEVTVNFEGFVVGRAESGEKQSADTATAPTLPTAPVPPSATLGFPADNVPLMQSIEVRGKNGHNELVETVYALVLTDGALPRMVALDDPEMYERAGEDFVEFRVEQMAQEVARQCDEQVPDAVIKFHTHPYGKIEPSEEDEQGTAAVAETFHETLDSRSFEFLQGIHRIQDGQVDPEAMRKPIAAGNCVSWYGERFHHTLTLFDAHFRNGRPTEIV